MRKKTTFANSHQANGRKGDGMSRYAENTSVSIEKSKGEIERTLVKYGATKFKQKNGHIKNDNT
jgi:hypothetical protein